MTKEELENKFITIHEFLVTCPFSKELYVDYFESIINSYNELEKELEVYKKALDISCKCLHKGNVYDYDESNYKSRGHWKSYCINKAKKEIDK